LAPPVETFDRGRDFAAWMRLTPRQHSTGSKPQAHPEGPDHLGDVRGRTGEPDPLRPGPSTASTPSRRRSPRPASSASTRTNTRCWRAPWAARSRSAPQGLDLGQPDRASVPAYRRRAAPH
jgi:hypothetical protein